MLGAGPARSIGVLSDEKNRSKEESSNRAREGI